ncbi:hypothetical protein AXF42_Ash009227 [Apostasia shenzhenica]|uniref:Uncharacterized protein n=1 Tax=Apostasia shenzhenica TaxID=1088818 RepID=A0A2I0B3H3_9ASPA|nr:hypothetical protein AXF42_Ash009227 [Apostasia shenzhenica]
MRRLCDVSWTHKLFRAFGTPGFQVAGDRIGIMSSRATPRCLCSNVGLGNLDCSRRLWAPELG